jgi:hypothetical protein
LFAPGLQPIDDEDGLPGLRVHVSLPDGRLYCTMPKIMGHDPTDPLSLTAPECEANICAPASCDSEDGLAVGTVQIDFHSLTRPGEVGWRHAEPYAIALCCLVVRRFDTLLVAGKCASADRVAHSSIRMTPTCCAMGRAVGTVVALAEAFAPGPTPDRKDRL